MSPNIHLHLDAPGLHLNAFLRAEALPEVVALVQRFRTEEMPNRPSAVAGGPGAGFRPAMPDRMRRRMGPGSDRLVLSPAGEATRSRFSSLPWETLTQLLPDKPFTSKLLLLTAWLEAQHRRSVFKGEVREYYARTGEPFPTNPGRDTRKLIIDGLVQKSPDRQHLSLSEAGWQEAARWLSGSDDEPGAAVPQT
jgi:hypothetical protein